MKILNTIFLLVTLSTNLFSQRKGTIFTPENFNSLKDLLEDVVPFINNKIVSNKLSKELKLSTTTVKEALLLNQNSGFLIESIILKNSVDGSTKFGNIKLVGLGKTPIDALYLYTTKKRLEPNLEDKYIKIDLQKSSFIWITINEGKLIYGDIPFYKEMYTQMVTMQANAELDAALRNANHNYILSDLIKSINKDKNLTKKYSTISKNAEKLSVRIKILEDLKFEYTNTLNEIGKNNDFLSKLDMIGNIIDFASLVIEAKNIYDQSLHSKINGAKDLKNLKNIGKDFSYTLNERKIKIDDKIIFERSEILKFGNEFQNEAKKLKISPEIIDKSFNVNEYLY